MVVVGSHRPSIGAGDGGGDEVADAMSLGMRASLTMMSPDSQCLPTKRARSVRGASTARGRKVV